MTIECWATLLTKAGLDKLKDEKIFNYFENARITPEKLAKSPTDWDSTLAGYGIPSGEICALIKDQLDVLKGNFSLILYPSFHHPIIPHHITSYHIIPHHTTSYQS